MSQPIRKIKAHDCYKITGRGLVVSVDLADSDGVRRGDIVQFELPGNELINEVQTYRVMGIEEARCLTWHASGEQCVMSRGLRVRGHKDPCVCTIDSRTGEIVDPDCFR